MTSSSTERAAALAALLIGAVAGGEAGAAPQLERTGREVEAGGDIPRLLVRPAFTLGYRLADGSYQRAGAVPGDVVLLSRSEADRLDGLGVTVEADANLGDVAEEVAAGLWTDEQIKAGKVTDLVAYVAQHPAERERVRAIEEARQGTNGKGPRSTVLTATEPTPVEDDAAARDAAARAEDAGDGTEDDPEALAEAQQDNHGGGTGE